MKKLTDFKGEEALNILADLIDPCMEIFTDEDVKKVYEDGTVAQCVKVVLKNHTTAVLTILATLEGVPVDEYDCNILTLPMKVMQVINDKGLQSFFHSAAQNNLNASSGLATETIMEERQ